MYFRLSFFLRPPSQKLCPDLDGIVQKGTPRTTKKDTNTLKNPF
ncbi:hypothetical protein CHCC20488_1570 [Bacillus paralicheniformis]|nr:hypothetical protein CHCC20497_1259 [Bacillus paralicheniformis]TWK42559.1 hypothetical protein CHCC20348_0271 [Bacillus paralicheniformis]TWK43152.1 hypothetical protein CHCC20347_1972 [Bacillus paralicheniformis]TWK87028.1 hypothetical protein CHCC20331_2389 [Bacillus paralicheniformis]TWN35676.1 hypothetical protein CHCC14523_2078 [Bacillus paralicheniformis]